VVRGEEERMVNMLGFEAVGWSKPLNVVSVVTEHMDFVCGEIEWSQVWVPQ